MCPQSLLFPITLSGADRWSCKSFSFSYQPQKTPALPECTLRLCSSGKSRRKHTRSLYRLSVFPLRFSLTYRFFSFLSHFRLSD
ncbi:hypothetical protein 2011_scaffold3_00047 [Bacteriophage sp.]|nr:hypothetical protein 2011_scaffold3_00047 [Bacteriophage sp.]